MAHSVLLEKRYFFNIYEVHDKIVKTKNNSNDRCSDGHREKRVSVTNSIPGILSKVGQILLRRGGSSEK